MYGRVSANLLQDHSLVEEVLKAIGFRNANEVICDFTSVNQKDGRDALNLESISYLRELVNIDLDQLEPAIIVYSDLFECRSELLARATPTI